MAEVTDPSVLSQLSGGEVTDPALIAQLTRKPATAGDRVDAAESGALGGAAYLAASPLDAVANVYNLGKAGIGYGYSKLTGNPVPKALEAGDPNPVAHWLTDQMDKAPDWTGTQIRRPDDAASRWLHTAGGVLPGALAGGGGSARTIAQGLSGGLAGAGAAQGVHEMHPFSDPTTQSMAEALMGVAGSVAGSKAVPGEVLPTPRNAAVTAGQDAGYVFPGAITNPTAVNKLMARVAGGATVNDAAQAKNQDLTNAAARTDLALPGDGPIHKSEISQLRIDENANYRAISNAGPITPDSAMVQALAAAKARTSSAGRVAPSLGESGATNTIDELLRKGVVGTPYDAGDGISAVSALRDKASEAFSAGRGGEATAYKAAAKAVEDNIGNSLSGNPQTAGLASAWQAARIRLAKAHTAEDAMDANGNVDATKLGKMVHADDPVGGQMQIAGESANAAPRAFKVPDAQPTGGHGGFWGPIIGASVGGEALSHIAGALGAGGMGQGAVALAPLATYAAGTAAKATARRLALAQALAKERGSSGVAPGLVGAASGATGLAPIPNQ